MAEVRRHAEVTAVLWVCVIAVIVRDVHGATDPQDVAALSELLGSWSVASSSLNWAGDPCANNWTGVYCDSTNTHVINLTLPDKNLQGSLPAGIQGLTNLQTLELSRNIHLGGQLPSELGNLINLHYLSLQHCSFSGPIPHALGSLVNLTFFGLNGNQLNDTIPPALGNLKHLAWLDISTNDISGTIPVSSSPGSGGIGLDNMTEVKHLHLNNNSLTGSIPPEIFSLQNLIHVIFDHNQLQSSIPPQIVNAKSLTILELEYNFLSGSLPQELGTLTTLVNLRLYNNNFSGTLPDLSNLTGLQLLDVSYNALAQQEFPSWLSALTSLRTLNLARSNINGSIPPDIFSLPHMQSLNLSQNEVSGNLDFSGNTTNALQVIDVQNNSIDGFIGQPESQGIVIEPLVQILLGGNPLCSYNYLAVRNSTSCGPSLIDDVWLLPPNTSCYAAHCSSSETLNSKTCSCAIPFSITLDLTGVTLSNLTMTFTASIETEIANGLTQLGIINLEPSQVLITQGEPVNGGQYSLYILFFPLVGTSLSESNQVAIVGALSQRLVTLSEGPFNVPYQKYAGYSNGNRRIGTGEIVGIVVGVSLITLVLVAYAVRQKRRADRAANNHPFASWGAGGADFGEAPKLKGARWFPLAELKMATNNWSESSKIGDGGYGEVYKGILTTGDVVAVKRAREGSMQGAGEFKNEIELLSRVHHRNLLGLVGFCYESGEQALVYEFMSNGTLRDNLHGKFSAPLSWEERLDIALGSARGLAYLHDHANPPIIHRDVKSANILLNERQVAKVADFGLSKLIPDEGKKEVVSETIKGTIGYLDPEYYNTHQLTDKSDVYSFGIVLLELLTAKDPVVKGKFVVREFRQALDKGGLTGLRPLLDPNLKGLSNADLDAFLKIAFVCVEESSRDRQSMADTVKELEALGARSYPNSGVQKLDFQNREDEPYRNFIGDTDAFGTSASPLTAKQAISSGFHYSGDFGANILRRSFNAVTSRIQSPRAGQHFHPLRPQSSYDGYGELPDL